MHKEARSHLIRDTYITPFIAVLQQAAGFGGTSRNRAIRVRDLIDKKPCMIYTYNCNNVEAVNCITM